MSKKNNIHVHIQSLGEVELKYISYGATRIFDKLLEDQIPDREFVIKVLFYQLVQPKIGFENFQKIPDEELEQLATAFIQNEDYTSKYFQDTGDLFKDFKQAIDIGNKKRSEEIRKSIEPIIKSTQASIRMFDRDFARIIQQSLVGTSYIQDSLRGLSAFSTAVSKQIADSQQMIALAVKPILEQYQSTAKILAESLRPQIEVWEKWSDQNKRIFESYSTYWADFQNKYNIAEAKAVEVLQKYKWFITPSMPFSIVFEIVTLDKKKGRQDKAVNKLFIQYFEADKWKNLEAMVASWENNPLFEKRHKILTDCLNTIKIVSGQNVNVANVVLPTLITQIDGVISDYLISKDISWEREYDDLVDRKTGIVKKVGRKSQLKKSKPKILTTPLDDLANDIFLNILFQRSQKGKPLATPFNFNRHKIIHGENKRYGRKDYLIRAFMVLDLLAHF